MNRSVDTFQACTQTDIALTGFRRPSLSLPIFLRIGEILNRHSSNDNSEEACTPDESFVRRTVFFLLIFMFSALLHKHVLKSNWHTRTHTVVDENSPGSSGIVQAHIQLVLSVSFVSLLSNEHRVLDADDNNGNTVARASEVMWSDALTLLM